MASKTGALRKMTVPSSANGQDTQGPTLAKGRTPSKDKELSKIRFQPIRMPELLLPPKEAAEVMKKFGLGRGALYGLLEGRNSPDVNVKRRQTSVQNIPLSERKKLFVPVRFKITSADLEDTPPLPSKTSRLNRKSTRIQKPAQKTARKELFKSDKPNKGTSSKFIPKDLKLAKKKQSLLDAANSLIDINKAESQLLKKSRIACTELSANRLIPSKLPQRFSFKQETICTSMKLDEMQTSLITFQEMEEACNCKAPLPTTKENLPLPDPARNSAADEIITLLQTHEDNFSKLKKKQQELKKQQNELKKQQVELKKRQDELTKRQDEYSCELEERLDEYTRDKERIVKLLDLQKENFRPVLKPLEESENRKMTLRKNQQRSVAFRLDDENLKSNKSCTPDDTSVENATLMYNSMRMNYGAVLSTPKFDRLVMHTPASARAQGRRNSVARKVQKQCLLLQDTPKPK